MDVDVFGNEGLANKVSVYLPSTADVDKPLTEEVTEQYLKLTLKYFSEMFGGATALSASGAWVTKDDTLVTEKVTIVYAFSDTLTREQLLSIKEFALMLKRELGQEAIAIEINGKLRFV